MVAGDLGDVADARAAAFDLDPASNGWRSGHLELDQDRSFSARSAAFQRYSRYQRPVRMPQTVSTSGPPRARMLKSVTWCEPGQQPVIMLVQPGGVG